MLSSPRGSRLTGFGLALVCLAMAAIASWGFSQLLHIPAPLLPFSMAVIVTAWFGGLEAGFLCTALGAVMLFGIFRGVMFTVLAIQPGTPLLISFCALGVILTVLVDRAARNYAEARGSKAELQNAIEQLSQANRSLEKFAHSATHSLRSPLRAIGVFAELLHVRQAPLLDNESKEYLRIIVNSVRQMNEAMDGLQEYARARQPPPALLLVDSNAVLRQAMQHLQPEISAAGAGITTDALPMVRADEGGLLQVLQSLLANAIKYRSEEAPQIHVSARRQGAEWIFSLADNGIGMESQDSESVFDLFRGGDSHPGNGRGIGLAICRATLERFGGRIWVESRPGAGSTFYFSLPAGVAISRGAGA